jgi:putative FmdB family regulatory protein
MPLYEYVCKKCGHAFEELQKVSDPPLKTCPKCRGRVEKRISAGGFQLKGAGWYKDGYQKPSAKPAEAATAKPTDTTAKPAPSGTAKPAAKSSE